jgi:hypothetical protein
VLDREQRERDGHQAEPAEADCRGHGDAAQLGHPDDLADAVHRHAEQSAVAAAPVGPAVQAGDAQDQHERDQRQPRLHQQGGLRPERTRQASGQSRTDHQRAVEAGRLERVGGRQQILRHEHGDEAGEAAERERIGQPRHQHGQRDDPVRRVARDQHEHDEHRRDQDLVEHHQVAPAPGQVEPGSQQRS